MKTQIFHLIDGAKKASGAVVIIDVFRAFSLECYLAAKGAEKIIPVGDKQIAYAQKEKDGNIVLIGERRGIKLPGFDYGNSPTEIANADFTGKTVIHTTSAGTQGVASASGADAIFVASLVNAKATAQHLKNCGFKQVSVVAMGLNGVEKSDEDEICAEYIKSVLEENEIPESEMQRRIDALRYTSGAKFFDKSNASVFPQSDFDYCIAFNKFNFALKIEKDEKTGFFTTKRIDVF